MRHFRFLSIVMVSFASFPLAQLCAQEKDRNDHSNAKGHLDDFFLNCDSLTSNACELVSGSFTNLDGKDIYTRDFVWFRAQKAETRQKDRLYIEGRCFDPRQDAKDSYWERKLVVGERGFRGVGPNPPLEPINLTSRLPNGELESFLERQKRLAFSHYRFPEICPLTVLAAINANPREGTLSSANSLFGRMKCIDEFTKDHLFIATWRLDVPNSSSRACVRIMFDKKQGDMPTYVEWRLRDKDATSDSDDPTSFAKIYNQIETKWVKVGKGKPTWAPIRVVNKEVGKSAQEWVIAATWKLNALKEDHFVVNKINDDRDGNALAKIRREMQNAAAKDKESEKPDNPGKIEKK